MDDLWGNAWSDPSPKTPQRAQPAASIPEWSTTTSSTVTNDDDQQQLDDLALPTSSFSSPSAWQTSSGIDSDLAWGSTNGFSNALGSPEWLGGASSMVEDWQMPTEGDTEEEMEDDVTAAHARPPIPETTDEEETIPRQEEPAKAVEIPIQPDEGGFAQSTSLDLQPPPTSFELSPPPDDLPTVAETLSSIANESELTPPAPAWTPPPSTYTLPTTEEPTWKSAWGEPSHEPLSPQAPEPLDDWARIQAEQAERDRRVPPELVDRVLADWTELSWKLYPPRKAAEDSEEAVEEGEEDVWPDGLSHIEGLYVPVP